MPFSYIEFPHDHIVELHVKSTHEPPPGPGDPPPGKPGPCGSYSHSGVGVSLIYVSLGTSDPGYTLDGTYLQPVNWPPIAWGYLPPPYDGVGPGSQVYVPGGNARSVTVDITNDGPMEYWVHPGTGFQDPSIWDRRTADGGVDFSVPAGPPTGRGNLGITIPNNGYLFPDPSNPQNLGTTIQIYMSALPGQALNAGISIVHDCVSSGDG